MQRIYQAIEKAEPGWPIDVVIMAVTVDILGKSVVPTSKSVFHHLENVRLDSLESTVRQKPCRFCGTSLDHFYDAGEGITRLPCSHLLHVGCFVQCLELSPAHDCPTCGHPSDIVKCQKEKLCIVNAITKPSEPRAWPMLLLMSSAGSMLTGALIGRLLVNRALG